MRLASLFLGLLIALQPISLASSRVTGQKTVSAAGTAERLSTISVACGMLIVSADDNNADVVVIGNSDVDASQATRKGLVLFPGQTEPYWSPTSRISLRDVWVDSETNNDGVAFNCLN